jgi:alpha-1,3-mannosyltransferase
MLSRGQLEWLIQSIVAKVPLIGAPLAGVLSSYAGVAVLLCLLEVLLNAVIVWRVPYTEIDWKSYMDEVEGPLLHNEFNYTNLR